MYDPEQGVRTAVGDMLSARNRPTATLFAGDFIVFVAGGSTAGNDLASAELFDPATRSWTARRRSSRASNSRRSSYQMAPSSWRAELVAILRRSAAEIYDPVSRTWSATGPMTTWRASPAMTLLQDGTVLITGGYGSRRRHEHRRVL